MTSRKNWLLKERSCRLDKFYTRKETAFKSLSILEEHIDLDIYDFHLEPSAGDGAFFNLLDPMKRIGLEIDPSLGDPDAKPTTNDHTMETKIIKKDFFDFVPERNKKYLVIGNPPFGKGNSKAIQFFNQAALFSDCIAFILPRTFKRISLQNRLNLYFDLSYSEDIPTDPCCFIPKMGAKCCFQI